MLSEKKIFFYSFFNHGFHIRQQPPIYLYILYACVRVREFTCPPIAIPHHTKKAREISPPCISEKQLFLIEFNPLYCVYIKLLA